jgi:YggT family protein
MGGFLVPIIKVVLAVLDLYWWIVILAVVASWLIAFGVINTYNRSAAIVLDILWRLTEPVFRPIRRVLPNFGGLDFSPFVVLLLLWLIEMWLVEFELQIR